MKLHWRLKHSNSPIYHNRERVHQRTYHCCYSCFQVTEKIAALQTHIHTVRVIHIRGIAPQKDLYSSNRYCTAQIGQPNALHSGQKTHYRHSLVYHQRRTLAVSVTLSQNGCRKSPILQRRARFSCALCGDRKLTLYIDSTFILDVYCQVWDRN